MDGKQGSNLFCEAQRNKKITTAGCRGHQRTYKFHLNKNNSHAYKQYNPLITPGSKLTMHAQTTLALIVWQRWCCLFLLVSRTDNNSLNRRPGSPFSSSQAHWKNALRPSYENCYRRVLVWTRDKTLVLNYIVAINLSQRQICLYRTWFVSVSSLLWYYRDKLRTNNKNNQ